AMQPLVDWKNSIGIDTTLVDVTTLTNSFPFINTYVQSVYATSNLSYLLLVGDYIEVKSGFYMGAISDASYSTVTADWYPDIFVGRFSAETTAQVTTQVQRVIAYEQQGHDISMGGWRASAMGIASSEGLNMGHYGESDHQHAELIRNELVASGFTMVDQIYDPGASKTDVINALNSGRRLVNYIGHGGTSGWSTTAFNSADIALLTNTGKLPFIHSVGCLGGDFNNGTCFGEAWLRSTYNGQPSGAIATYYASMNQTWAEPMYCQGNHSISSIYGAAERFWMELNWSVGGCWYGGSCAMMDITGNTGRDLFMTWQIFGDPSLRISGALQGQTLVADATTVSLSASSDTTFTIKAGLDHRGDTYFLLGGVTGTTPGISLPVGLVVPLNFDFFTQMTLAYANTPLFQNFYGILDSAGEATPVLSTTGLTPMDPGLAGAMMYFAAVVWPNGKPYELATNIRILTFVN
ncbi:MAG: C25 family cysteine peptidase, partial [Planctomycetota bacterium]